MESVGLKSTQSQSLPGESSSVQVAKSILFPLLDFICKMLFIDLGRFYHLREEVILYSYYVLTCGQCYSNAQSMSTASSCAYSASVSTHAHKELCILRTYARMYICTLFLLPCGKYVCGFVQVSCSSPSPSGAVPLDDVALTPAQSLSKYRPH